MPNRTEPQSPDAGLQATVTHLFRLLSAVRLKIGMVSDAAFWPRTRNRSNVSEMDVPRNLDGRVALVTGAGSGLGQASAIELARRGAHVAFTELPDRLDRAAETLERIEAAGGSGLVLALDVTDLENIRQVAETTAAIRGRIDMLVNNAGINIRQDAFDVTEEAWDKVIDTDLKGVFFMAQAVGRIMRDQNPRGGSIVNIASTMGLGGYYQRSAYCSAKAGVVNLTKVLALEWAPVGIRVNSVCPAFVDTPLTRPMFESQPAAFDDIIFRTPMGRLGLPEEVATAVAFLCGPESSYVNGLPLTVDGGWTAT
jgi:NAD(P)-dependent dehydrogenase (short-subunit alcohol dehydrogenase family)